MCAATMVATSKPEYALDVVQNPVQARMVSPIWSKVWVALS
jgi:hypothetical protein